MIRLKNDNANKNLNLFTITCMKYYGDKNSKHKFINEI